MFFFCQGKRFLSRDFHEGRTSGFYGYYSSLRNSLLFKYYSRKVPRVQNPQITNIPPLGLIVQEAKFDLRRQVFIHHPFPRFSDLSVDNLSFPGERNITYTTDVGYVLDYFEREGDLDPITDADLELLFDIDEEFGTNSDN